MQTELAAENLPRPVKIVGINELGEESGNALATAQRDLPWLQDGDTNGNGQSDVWHEVWHAARRDLTILDAANEKLGTINLTS